MEFFTKVKSLSDGMIIGILLTLFLAILFLIFNDNRKSFVKFSNKAFLHLDMAYRMNIDNVMTEDYSVLNPEQITLLKEKVKINEENKKHHLELINMLSKNNYALYTMLPFLSAITAILTFLLVQKGWAQCNLFIRSFFIFFSTVTALVGMYPEVYQQEESIQGNIDSYIKYKSIQKSIFDYSITAPILKGDSINFNVFVDSINQEEMKLNKIKLIPPQITRS